MFAERLQLRQQFFGGGIIVFIGQFRDRVESDGETVFQIAGSDIQLRGQQHLIGVDGKLSHAMRLTLNGGGGESLSHSGQ